MGWQRRKLVDIIKIKYRLVVYCFEMKLSYETWIKNCNLILYKRYTYEREVSEKHLA